MSLLKNPVLFVLLMLTCITNELTGQCPTGNVIIKSQAEANQFKVDYPDCTKLEGNLGFCFPNSEIVNLEGLNNIDTIMGSVYTGEDCKIKSYVGLEKLKYIGGSLSLQEFGGPVNLQGLNNVVRIEGNISFDELGGLQSFEGLDNLESIGGDLDLEDNYSLLELKGMPKLKTIEGSVNIEGHNLLFSIDGLNQLTSIGGDFDVENNDSLVNINGFAALNSIGGYLNIRRNESLENIESFGGDELTVGGLLRIYKNPEQLDLSGLQSIVSINGMLDIRENRNLKSLEGLNNIDPLSITDLLITDCDSLSYCSVKSICDYLQIDMASFFFDLNDTGCNSGVEVATICSSPTSTDELHTNDNIQIFPNPSAGLINIQNADEAPSGNYILRSIHGQLLKVIPFQSSTTVLDLSGLSKGVYLLGLSGREEGYYKILKF